MKRFHRFNLFATILCVIISCSVLASDELWFDSYTSNDGLPDNLVFEICQDQNGFMWIGTNHGLCRFDGYNFKNFLPVSNSPDGISGLKIWDLHNDRNGKLWIGTEDGGLNLYNHNLESFEQPYRDDSIYRSSLNAVFEIEEDQEGNLWIGGSKEVIKIDSSGKLSNEFNKKSNVFSHNNNVVRTLEFDNFGKLWIGTEGHLYIADFSNDTITCIDLTCQLEAFNDINSLYLDSKKRMWVSTDLNGAFVVDPLTYTTISIDLKSDNKRSKTTRDIIEDNTGRYWICTRAGVFIYDHHSKTAQQYTHDDRKLNSINHNSTICLHEDNDNSIWIGSRQGVNLYCDNKQIFQNFTAFPSDASHRYLNCGTVYAIWVDNNRNIWVGTEEGGVNIYNPETNLYTYLMQNKRKPNSLSENCIKAFLDDKKGNVWIGTFHGGIDIYNLNTRKIVNCKHDPEDNGSLSSNDIWDFALDKNGNVWIASSRGINKYIHQSDSFMHFPELSQDQKINWIECDSKDNIWFGSNNEIVIYNLRSKKTYRHNENSLSFLEDSNGRYWITTFNEGIVEYSITEGALQYYNMEHGLAENQTFCILEDQNYHLWISTSNGLSRFDPRLEVFQNFNQTNGIKNSAYCYGAAYKTQNGEMLFGGISGFNKFNPGQVNIISKASPIILTELRVQNRKVEIDQSGNGILNRSICLTNEIYLNHTENAFSVEFAALHFNSAKSNLYSYYLEGLEKEWTQASDKRIANYTNLDPGNYVLHICQVINGARQTSHEQLLTIQVLPPFWKKLWFKILMFILIFATINFVIFYSLYRQRLKMKLMLEVEKANQIVEMNNSKLKFFTNIAHEIRTPLTLILTPIEKLRFSTIMTDEISSYVEIVHRNANKLNDLINQLLDFRKLESKHLRLNLLQGDIVETVYDAVNGYQSYAKESRIKLVFESTYENLYALYDPDKIGKVINNLLSNALKFTNEDGCIVVSLNLLDIDRNNESNTDSDDLKQIEITVSDNGIGIDEKNIERIFDRFFQVDSMNNKTGTGIGLSFSKELVKLHNGSLFVKSKLNVGSQFTVLIPYVKAIKNEKHIHSEFENDENGNKDTFEGSIMLIVEDNADVRLLIRNHFCQQFQVYESKNGLDGWKQTLRRIPDIIISDVLMPDMDGFEFCTKVKTDQRTSHIPFILLSALHAKEHVIKGLEISADDYLTKPFDLNILQAKIDNILSIRNAYKEKYSSELTLQPKNIQVDLPDINFINKAIEVVEANISDVDFDINKFASEIGVSLTQLYRKLNALTGMTVKEFIRDIRLKRSAQLLTHDSVRISEVAFGVGFKDLSHFSKCFRQKYGVTAKQYKMNNCKA
jgi:signal transduction histidine kinase/ligand-binding sensor domain-containing protein/AraC-like DNA-binding protein